MLGFKSILSAVLFLFISNSNIVFAQSNFLSSAGGNANDEAMDLVVDNAGNTFTTGYFSQSASFGSFNLNAAGSGDIFIAKQNAVGNYIWVVRAGGSNSDRGLAISADANGDIYVTGTFTGLANFGPTILTSNGQQDIFISKLDANGNFIWTQKFGGLDNDVPYDIVNDANGNCIITGQFRDTVQFGGQTVYSMINPFTGFASADLFVLKLNNLGSVLWVKTGSAKYDDRGMALAINNQNQIIVCGQYSDTLTMSNTYLNNGFNVGFVCLLDPNGTEIWWRRLAAQQLTTYDIQCFGTDIYVTGDVKGGIYINTNPTTTIPNNSSNSAFLFKLNHNGNLVWSNLVSSDNMISSRKVAVDPSGNIYTAGFFKCNLTSISSNYGTGIFLSAGYRDLFLFKYSPAGARLWEKHAGGPGDDFCNGLGIVTGDKPVICGSFSQAFATRSFPGFLNASNAYHYQTDNINITNCNNSNYESYVAINSAGFNDVMSGCIFDDQQRLFDYFKRNNTCNMNIVSPYINQNEDTVFACDSVILIVNTNTTIDGINAPLYHYLWSDNSTNDSLIIFQSGWVYVNISTVDDCRSYFDSVYVVIHHSPDEPIIFSSNSIIEQAIPLLGCYDKLAMMLGDTTVLTAGNITAGYDYKWFTPLGVFQNTPTVLAYAQGVYSLQVTSPQAGCTNSKCVGLIYYQNGNCQLNSNYNPQLFFHDSISEITDTIKICKEDFFVVELVDSTYYVNGIQSILNTFSFWTITGGFEFQFPVSSPNTFSYHIQSFKAISSGNCTISVDIVDPINHFVLQTVVRQFYLDVYTAPLNLPVISGPAGYCPGDTVQLFASGGQYYEWSGPGFVAFNSDSSIVSVVQEGAYEIFSVTIDSVLGCRSEEIGYFNLETLPNPEITMIPNHGVICPGDSVLLQAEPGQNYIWYGPSGNVISTTDFVYVQSPGDYHYNFTNTGGCPLVSVYAEVNQYSTPYIDTDPGLTICANGPVQINIQSNAAALVQWNTPLSGNSFSQIVNGVGVYSATVNFCNISTTAIIEIIPSSIQAQILALGNDTICVGESLVLMANPGMTDYLWLPENYNNSTFIVTEPGTYYLQTYNDEGCIGGDSINIYFYPEVESLQAFDTAVCAGSSLELIANSVLPVYWFSDLFSPSVYNGDSLLIQISNSDTIVYAATFNGNCYSERIAYQIHVSTGSVAPIVSGNNHLCYGDLLQLSVDSIPGLTYSWSGPNNFIGTNSSIEITFDNNIAGNYSLVVSDSICSSAPTTILVSIHQPVLNYWTDSIIYFCPSDSLLLKADTLIGTYTWNNGMVGDVIFAQTNQFYSFVYSDSMGCVAHSDTIHVMHYTVSTTLSIPDTSICPGAFLNYTFPGSNIIWLDVNGNLLSQGDNFSLVDLLVESTFLWFETDSNGCGTEVDTFIVHIIPVSQAPIIQIPSLICENQTLSIYADTTGVNFYWSNAAGIVSTQDTLSFSSIQINQGGNYSLVVSSGSCFSDTSFFQLSITELPNIIVSGNHLACPIDSIVIEINCDEDIIWNNGLIGSNQVFYVSDTGSYWVSAINICGTIYESVEIIFHQNPTANAGPDRTINPGSSVQLDGSGGGDYSWYPNLFLDCSTCENPMSTPPNYIIYVLTVTDENGCTDSDSMKVNLEYVDFCFVPNSFTPDGDGVNDYFQIFVTEGISFTLRIFDRWGEMIFVSSTAQEGWNGTYKGNPVPNGTYVYQVEYQVANGDQLSKSGALTLIR